MKAVLALAGKIGWFHTVVTTGCFSGYAPIAPGTAGTVVAIPLYLLLLKIGEMLGTDWISWIPYTLVSVLLFFLGMQGATRIEDVTKRQDNGIIVIDEMVGYWVTMFLLPQRWLFILLGFFVFRFFDILKPYPIRRLDNNPNLKGFGVMIDDVVAGVYGNIVLQIVVRLMSYAS